MLKEANFAKHNASELKQNSSDILNDATNIKTETEIFI